LPSKVKNSPIISKGSNTAAILGLSYSFWNFHTFSMCSRMTSRA
jgi:hypothetical protein